MFALLRCPSPPFPAVASCGARWFRSSFAKSPGNLAYVAAQCVMWPVTSRDCESPPACGGLLPRQQLTAGTFRESAGSWLQVGQALALPTTLSMFPGCTLGRAPNFYLSLTPLLCPNSKSEASLLRASRQNLHFLQPEHHQSEGPFMGSTSDQAICATPYPDRWTSWSEMQIKALGVALQVGVNIIHSSPCPSPLEKQPGFVLPQRVKSKS